MKNIAIITARGNSKRIPRKNIKSFCGKPIISYSIKACQDSSLFDKIIVSTDDPEIAEVSKSLGAEVPFIRSVKNSDDFATTSDVLDEVLIKLRNLGIDPEIFCCLYPTAPFVTADLLRRSFNIFQSENSEALCPIVRFSFPPQRGFIAEKNKIKYAQPEFQNTRSQDIEPLYHDVGQFYWRKTNSFLESKKLITDNTSYIEIPESQARDIDTLEDWKIAEALFKCQKLD